MKFISLFVQIMEGLETSELLAHRHDLRCHGLPNHFIPTTTLPRWIFTLLAYRESLRRIEACLNSCPPRSYSMGIRGNVTRTNLIYANEHRDWRVFAEAHGFLMRRAQRLCADLCASLDWRPIDSHWMRLSMS